MKHEPIVFGCSCHPDAYPIVLHHKTSLICSGCGTAYSWYRDDGLLGQLFAFHPKGKEHASHAINLEWPA